MGYYSDLWKKQKESGVYQTKDGGKVYASESAKQADKAVQEAVKSAQQQQSSGELKTTSGGTVKSNKSNSSPVYVPKTTAAPNLTYSAPTVSFTPVVQAAKTKPTNVKSAIGAVDGSSIAANAYKQKMAAKQQANEDEQDEWKQDAVSSYYGNKAYNQYKTRDGGFVQGKAKENPFMGTTNSQAGSNNYQYGYTVTPKDNLYSRETALNLLKRYGLTEADIGIPLEAMYTGDNRYQLPYLLNKPDNYTFLSGSKLMTVGELKQQLTNGQYVPNTAGQTYVAQPATASAEVDVMGDYEDDYGMGDYAQAIIDAQNAQYAALLQQLQNQSGVLNQQYDANAADLYAQYRRAGLAMPELMAGTATGIADSLALQNNLNFQNNLAANELERAAAQNELNAQANQIQADADLQAAQTAAEWAQMVYQQRQKEQNDVGGDNGANNTPPVSLPGVTDDVAKWDTNSVVDYLLKRFYTNLTPDNIAKALNQLMANGLPESVAQAVADKYGMEMQ